MYLNKCKKILSVVLSAVLLGSSASCVKIEMRNSDINSIEKEAETSETAPQMLMQATRKNAVESIPVEIEEETTPVVPKETLAISVCGDIIVDNSIISDAANRAGDGQSYSFLRMYTRIYSTLSSADLSLCSYKEAEDVDSPIESVGALYDLGIDAVNTGSAKDISSYLEEYNLYDINENSDSILINEGDLAIASLSLSEKDCMGDKYKSDIEYADFMSDIVIVFVDWEENTAEKDKAAVMRKIAEAGADIIVGNGDNIGKIEWIDTGDGTLTLAAYSLGNILSTADDAQSLYGGILNLSVEYGDGSIELSNVSLIPTVTHYVASESEEVSGYQVFTFDAYNDELAGSHAVSDITMDKLKNSVKSVVSEDFLPDYLR